MEAEAFHLGLCKDTGQYLVLGSTAEQKFWELRPKVLQLWLWATHTPSSGVEAAFNAFDADESDGLDMSEFAKIIRPLGLSLAEEREVFHL